MWPFKVDKIKSINKMLSKKIASCDSLINSYNGEHLKMTEQEEAALKLAEARKFGYEAIAETLNDKQKEYLYDGLHRFNCRAFTEIVVRCIMALGIEGMGFLVGADMAAWSAGVLGVTTVFNFKAFKDGEKSKQKMLDKTIKVVLEPFPEYTKVSHKEIAQ